ncbi:aldo/keto reductase [Paenibacillus caui]|uniref:aldo/keto reductase n=1 Tax=Paenibacillus caui TaxID=2873927 RepID=UPI001CA9E2DD|nr:aldo/keto reductase [Paenibacillus caui]
MNMPLQQRGIPASRLSLGCMGFGGEWDASKPITGEHVKQAHEAVEAALGAGIHFFDHANIYTRGKAEKVFGQVLKERPGLREQIIIQSKCGIRLYDGDDEAPGRYDFSKEHIIASVDDSLKRLGIPYLDILLLHRPDPLMDRYEVAEALHQLKFSGKVRYFGVSNMSAGQIRLLQSALGEPLIVNQLEMSLLKAGFVETGVNVNQAVAADNVFPEGTLEYCQLENIQLQAWSPLAQGLFSGRSTADQSEAVQNTAALVKRYAEEKNTAPEAIVLAWLLKHPAQIQPVIGTVNPQRIAACGEAVHVTLTREEWYKLFITSRGRAMA